MLHPIFCRGELTGIIGFELCDRQRALSDKDVYLLRAAANSISAALQRVSSESQLREAHTFLSNILRSSTEYAILATDLDFRVLHYTPVAESIFGYPSVEVIGHTIAETGIFEDYDDSFYFHITSAVVSRGSWEMEIDVRDSSLRYRTVHVVATGMRDENADLCGYLFIARDVTEQRGNERKMLESQRMESVGLLAGGIAHDFNNILMGILGYASLAKDKLEYGHPAFRMLHTIEQSADRAAVLTNQLLAYARGGKYQSVPLRLDSQLDDLLDILATNLPKGLELEKLYSPHLPVVLADPAQIQQVLMNICLNAGEAITQQLELQGTEEMNGRIIFTTGQIEITEELATSSAEFAEVLPGRYVYLGVEDNGCGMDEETRQRIFDPFYTTKFTGRGLGLSAVQGIVSNHGGFIQVFSEAGRGSRFTIYLPASVQQYEEAGAEELISLGGEETILVVDDEEVVRQVTLLTLTNLGYRVMLAVTAREGLEVFQRHSEQISLVMLDLTLPGLNGESVLEDILKLNPRVPVLLTSGYDEARARGARSFERSAGFLQKPYSQEVLGRAIRSILDGGREAELA